jgi:hypothetical protein
MRTISLTVSVAAVPMPLIEYLRHHQSRIIATPGFGRPKAPSETGDRSSLPSFTRLPTSLKLRWTSRRTGRSFDPAGTWRVTGDTKNKSGGRDSVEPKSSVPFERASRLSPYSSLNQKKSETDKMSVPRLIFSSNSPSSASGVSPGHWACRAR